MLLMLLFTKNTKIVIDLDFQKTAVFKQTNSFRLLLFITFLSAALLIIDASMLQMHEKSVADPEFEERGETWYIGMYPHLFC